MKIFNFYIIGQKKYDQLVYIYNRYLTMITDYDLLKKEYDDLNKKYERLTDRDEKGRFVKKEE